MLEDLIKSKIEEVDTAENSEDDIPEAYNPLNDVLQYRLLYEKGQALSAAGPSPGGRGMWALLQTLGATLRLLAPAALFTLLCGRDSPLVRLLQHCDRAVRNALFPSSSQTEDILKWLCDALPGENRPDSLDAVWADGTLLCDLIESVVPGSCEGHADLPADLGHAQRLAEQYLGVTPIFSKVELTQKSLSTYQECRLTHYLSCVRDAISRMTPPISRAGPPLLNTQAYTLDYVARGMGLVTAFRNKRSSFYVYPTAQQGLEPGDISVQIKGPGNCYGSILIPVIYGKAHIIRNVFLNLGNRQNFIPNPSPLTQGPSYMRTYDKMNVQKNYFVPKIKNDIDVCIFIRHDRVKVCYTTTVVGYHELSLISKGCHLIGSPFSVSVGAGSVEKQDSKDYLDEDIMIEDVEQPERKVVFRIVDFVTEKMLLTEDGRLERISNEDADALVQTKGSVEDLTNKYRKISNNTALALRGPDLIEYQSNADVNGIKIIITTDFNKHFRAIVEKVIAVIRVCKAFENISTTAQKSTGASPKIFTATPDIVNSTRSESCAKKSFTEINEPKLERQESRESAKELRKKFKSKLSSFNATTEKVEAYTSTDEEESTHIEKKSHQIYRNPLQAGASIEIIISSFDDDDEFVPKYVPPVLPILMEIPERPKSPVFKIIGSADDKIDPKILNEFELHKLESQIFDSLDGYLDNYCSETDNALNTSITIVEDTPIQDSRVSPSIDFHIGEPVTPTHVMNAPSSLEPDMDSIILAPNLEEALEKYDMKMQKFREPETSQCNESGSSNYETPLQQTPYEEMTDKEILRMYDDPSPSQDFHGAKHSDLENENNISNKYGVNNDLNVVQRAVSIERRVIESNNDHLELQESFLHNLEADRIPPIPVRYNSLETWDSAYISIDEVNSSPETNDNSSKSDFSPRGKLVSIKENEQECMYAQMIYREPMELSKIFNKLGPTESELWDFPENKNENVCKNFENTPSINKNSKISKAELKKLLNESPKVTVLPKVVSKTKFTENKVDNENNVFKTEEINSIGEILYYRNYISKHKSPKNFRDTIHGTTKTIEESDDSASDSNADMKLSTEPEACNSTEKLLPTKNTKKVISSAQLETESKDTNHLSEKQLDTFKHIAKDQHTYTQSELKRKQHKTQEINNLNGKKLVLSKLIIDKKDYWDDKIKTYQRKEEKKTRTITRKNSPLIQRNDSLSKKRGKQILAKLPSFTEKWKNSFEPQINNTNEIDGNHSNASHNSLVARWKDYWNEKVEKTQSPENSNNITPKHTNKSQDSINNNHMDSTKNKLTIFNEDQKEYKVERSTKEKGDCLEISDSREDNISALESPDKLTKQDANHLFSNKCQLTSINLNTLTERIDTFLDNVSNPSPIIELEESRFSTPESPFGGIVSKRINAFDKNNNRTEKVYKGEMLKFENAVDPLFITYNKKSSEKINALHPIFSTPSLEIVKCNESIPHNDNDRSIKSQKSTQNNVIIDEIEDSKRDCHENKIPTNGEDTDELNSKRLSRTVSEIKAKIENLSERIVQNARESFTKHRSKTMDHPKSDVVNKLKKNFSLDKIYNENNEKIVSPKRLIKDEYFYSYDFNKNSQESMSEDSNNLIVKKTLENVEIKTNFHSGDDTKKETDLIKNTPEKLPNYEEEEVNIFRPIGNILAVFENKLTSNERRKDFRQRGEKASIETILAEEWRARTSSLDAKNREGTQEPSDKASLMENSMNIEKVLHPENEQEITTVLKPLFQDTNKTLEQTCSNSLAKTNPEKEQIETRNYKLRFIRAKKYFQTLDEQQKETESNQTVEKLNECEKLLQNDWSKTQRNKHSTESTDIDETLNVHTENNTEDISKKGITKMVHKKTTLKAFSAPTSDTECEKRRNTWMGGEGQLKKISEKFHVEGLFQDISGKSNNTTVGSFRGIPHKTAVIASFQSMENISQQSSYEYTVSQMEDFAKKNGIVNAQTYHSEFPYLPTTDPDKYRARYDAAASGLIQRKDLLGTQNHRRYSAPEKIEMKLNFITHV